MFEVKQSPIHGLGLFATQFIPADALISPIEGRPAYEDGPYVLWMEEDQGIEVLNDVKYINHSKEPNAAYYDDLTVVALRDIYPGEEITHNYIGDGQLESESEIDFAM